MRKLSALPILLLLALLPDAAGAQFVGIPTTIAQLPTCNAGRHGRIWVVRDAVGNDDCAVGGGTDAAVCLCSSGSFVAIIAASVPAADSILESMLKAVDAAADEECLTYESTVGDFEWQTCGSAGIGGSTGATDNAILRADGTGGATLQTSGWVIDDSSVLTSSAGPYLYPVSSTRLLIRAGSTDVDMYSNDKVNIAIGGQPAAQIFASTEVRLPSGSQFSFSSSTANAASADTGLARNAAGVVRVSDGSTGIGKLLNAVLVEANTAGSGTPNAIAATESGTVFTNEGVTAKNFHTLPSAVAGHQFTFIVQDADGMRVVANTDDAIRVIDKVTAAAGYIESTTIGSTVTLVSINAVEWYATSIKGTWTDGTFTYDDTSLTTP